MTNKTQTVEVVNKDKLFEFCKQQYDFIDGVNLSIPEREVLGQSLACLWQRINENKDEKALNYKELSFAWKAMIKSSTTSVAVPLGLSMDSFSRFTYPYEVWPVDLLPL